MKEMGTAYNPKEVESKIYEKWEKSGYFTPENLPCVKTKKDCRPYSIMIAPPNITGSLHMGHALENTISDILIRYHRMKGFKTLWMPGTDHAGIATQNVVEKDLKKQGLTRHDLGREKFLEKVLEWKEKYGNTILGQLKSLGCSLDWSRTRFTMDEKYQLAVKTAFENYRAKGLIYEGERVINWCIKDQTALSDLELEYVEEKSKLWHLKYPLKPRIDADKNRGLTRIEPEYIVVATTRPETMLGDTAVAVNPKDKRYAKLVGKTVVLPIVGREIPIIADRLVEMEFGTGAVKVTPAHDSADSAMAERNKLPYIKVINEIGKIINVDAELARTNSNSGGPARLNDDSRSGGFDGLKMAEAREKVLEKLKELGLLEKEEEFTHNVAKCYRCASTIEPMLSKQWFVNMKPLAEKAIKAIKAGEVKYTPERWQKISLDWLQNIHDWCISRNIWWGHKIPIEGSEFTFDTWFSSALWPFATLGWPEKTESLKEYYPTNVISSARDILHLWISRMIFSGLEFMGDVPFKQVIIHSTVQAADGRRMSKSLGTGIDPLVLIEKYGADATRFGLIFQEFGGQEIRFNEQNIMMGKKFANKLWNIARFVMTKTHSTGSTGSPQGSSGQALRQGSGRAGGKISEVGGENFSATKLDDSDKTILAKLEETKKAVSKNIEDYKFGETAHILYDFIWHDFADKYIEESKSKIGEEINAILSHILINSLKMLHPFMPFITEEIWSYLGQEDLLMVAEWPAR